MRMNKPPHVGELITETLNELNLSIDILCWKVRNEYIRNRTAR